MNRRNLPEKHSEADIRLMRQGDWKILADNKMTTFELYNLRQDTGEKHNLAESEPRRLAAMKKKLMKLHAEIEAEGPKWGRE